MSLKVAGTFVIFTVCQCYVNRHLLESDKSTGDSERLMKHIKSVTTMVKQNQLPLNESNYFIDSFNGLLSQLVVTEYTSGECWDLKASEEQRAYDVFEGGIKVSNITFMFHSNSKSEVNLNNLTRNMNFTTGYTHMFGFYMKEAHLCAFTNATVSYVPLQLFNQFDSLKTELLAVIEFYSNVVNATTIQTTPEIPQLPEFRSS